MKKFFATVFVILLLTPCFALTVEEVVEGGMQTSGIVKEAQIALQKTVNSNTVYVDFLPSFNLGFAGNLKTGERADISLTDLSLTETVSLNTLYSLLSGEKTFKHKKAVALYDQTVYAEVLGLQADYWNVFAKKKAVERANNAVLNAKAVLDTAVERYNASMVSEMVVKQANLALSDRQIALDNARTSFSDALKDHSVSCGIELNEQIEFEEIPEFTYEMFEKLKTMSDVSLMKVSAVKMADYDVSLAKISYISQLKSPISLNITGKVLLKNNEPSASAGISMGISPKPSYAFDNKNALLSLDAAKLVYERTLNSKKTQLEKFISALKNNLDKRENLILHMNLALENYNMMNEAYENSLVSFADLTNAYESYADSLASIDDNNFNMMLSLCNISTLIEVPLATVMEALK